jgi:hypothetical protein
MGENPGIKYYGLDLEGRRDERLENRVNIQPLPA